MSVPAPPSRTSVVLGSYDVVAVTALEEVDSLAALAAPARAAGVDAVVSRVSIDMVRPVPSPQVIRAARV